MVSPGLAAVSCMGPVYTKSRTRPFQRLLWVAARHSVPSVTTGGHSSFSARPHLFSASGCRKRCAARQLGQPRGASCFGAACAFFPAARGLPRARRFLRVRGPIRRSASNADPRATNGKTNRATRAIRLVFIRGPLDWTHAPRREIGIARSHHFDHDVMSSHQPAAPRDEQRFHRAAVGKTAPAHHVPPR